MLGNQVMMPVSFRGSLVSVDFAVFLPRQEVLILQSLHRHHILLTSRRVAGYFCCCAFRSWRFVFESWGRLENIVCLGICKLCLLICRTLFKLPCCYPGEDENGAASDLCSSYSLFSILKISLIIRVSVATVSTENFNY